MFLKNLFPALIISCAVIAHASFFAHAMTNSVMPGGQGAKAQRLVQDTVFLIDNGKAASRAPEAARKELIRRPAEEYAVLLPVGAITIEPSGRKTKWENKTYDFLSSGPAVPIEKPGLPKMTVRQEKYTEYYSLIKEKIQRNISCLTKDHMPQGTVSAIFSLSSEGELVCIDKIVSVSGDKSAERVTRDGIRKSACFPAFPLELGKDPIQFSLQVNFSSN